MSTLIWDEIGSRFYESGIDRGVLYLSDGNGVPWNGLISVSENIGGSESNPIYFDGVKFADIIVPGDFAATLTAYTYPDEFLECEGISDVGNGLFAANQQPQRFGLSYRTRIGNDETGLDLGYKIHILYNLTAIPAAKNFQTFSDTPDAITFQWAITAIPGEVPGFRPTAHLIFDSRKTSPLLLQDIEDTLYGDSLTEATLPPISTLALFISDWVIIRITDNGDGTWTAEGPDEMITMLDSTTFEINPANAIYLGVDKYMISNTTY